MQICDFSTPQNLDVVAQHFAGVVGYVSDYALKNLSAATFNGALARNLTVTLVCEQGAEQAQRGAAGGTHDSLVANAQATALGYDPMATIYYVAEDPHTIPTTEYAAVAAYFGALTGRPRGAYGGLPLVTWLMEQGLATKGWVVQTWGGISSLVHLEQLVGAPQYGLAVDADLVLQNDYGQHPRPVITHPQEVVMGIPTSCTDQGAVRSQIREWWATFHTDSMTVDDQNLFLLCFTEPVANKGFGGNPDLLLAGIIDNAGSKGTLRPQFVGSV